MKYIKVILHIKIKDQLIMIINIFLGIKIKICMKKDSEAYIIKTNENSEIKKGKNGNKKKQIKKEGK